MEGAVDEARREKKPTLACQPINEPAALITVHDHVTFHH